MNETKLNNSIELRETAEAINNQIDNFRNVRGEGRIGWKSKYAKRAHKEEMNKTRELFIDPLTELYNRRFFLEVLEKEIEQAKRLGTFLSLVFIDLDNFKLINDEKNHSFGDRFLKKAARKLKKLARKGDYVCRIGGEEMAIIMPSALLDEGKNEFFMNRIEDLRENLEKGAYDKERRIGTGSFGIATLEKNMTMEELFQLADARQKKAKETKNKVVFN